MVSEPVRAMAPTTTPTVSQRAEELEDAMGNLETKLSDLVSNAVEKAMGTMLKGQTEASLNSVIGLSNPWTMKLRGLLGDSEVVVMIDPGATHNFVSLEKIKALQIPITESGGFGVSLGNGEAIKGQGVCRELVLQLDGGVVIKEDFLPLTLGTSDVILGVQWLEKLGNVVTNWKSQVMQFEVGEIQ